MLFLCFLGFMPVGITPKESLRDKNTKNLGDLKAEMFNESSAPKGRSTSTMDEVHRTKTKIIKAL